MTAFNFRYKNNSTWYPVTGFDRGKVILPKIDLTKLEQSILGEYNKVENVEDSKEYIIPEHELKL